MTVPTRMKSAPLASCSRVIFPGGTEVVGGGGLGFGGAGAGAGAGGVDSGSCWQPVVAADTKSNIIGNTMIALSNTVITLSPPFHH